MDNQKQGGSKPKGGGAASVVNLDLRVVPAQALYDELVRRGAAGAIPKKTHIELWYDAEQLTPDLEGTL
jgi:hypothetical protein